MSYHKEIGNSSSLFAGTWYDECVMKAAARKAINDSRSDITRLPNWGKAASLLATREGIAIDEAFQWLNAVRFSN